MKIKVVVDSSDWFEIVDKEIDPEIYTYFILRAVNLVWYLEAYNKKGQRCLYYQVEHPKKLKKELNIKLIFGNQYRKKEELL